MKQIKEYSTEFQEEAVKLVIESKRSQESFV